MIVEQNVPLQPHNSFGIVAKARALVRVRGEPDVQQLLNDAEYGPIPLETVSEYLHALESIGVIRVVH